MRAEMPESVRDGSKIYQELRRAILRLEMRPGSVIEEARLSERLKVSRTPIREAVIQLISDGLVIRDGRTARVAPLEFDDVPRIFDAVRIASRLVNRLAAENRSDEDLARMKSSLIAFEGTIDGSDGLTRSEVNLAFHLHIAHACQNSYIQQFYESALRAHIRLARACFSGDERRDFGGTGGEDDVRAHLKETARQHRLIYKAIENQAVQEADRLAIVHEDLSRSRLQTKLFSHGSAVPPDLAIVSQENERAVAGTKRPERVGSGRMIGNAE